MTHRNALPTPGGVLQIGCAAGCPGIRSTPLHERRSGVGSRIASGVLAPGGIDMHRRLAPGFRIGASFQARFSDDGSLLATLGKRITLWDVASRERMAAGPPFRHAS